MQLPVQHGAPEGGASGRPARSSSLGQTAGKRRRKPARPASGCLDTSEPIRASKSSPRRPSVCASREGRHSGGRSTGASPYGASAGSSRRPVGATQETCRGGGDCADRDTDTIHNGGDHGLGAVSPADGPPRLARECLWLTGTPRAGLRQRTRATNSRRKSRRENKTAPPLQPPSQPSAPERNATPL
jgi:hypothetical protein